MLETEFKRDMHNKYLIVKGRGKADGYAMAMLLNNRIPGILPVELRIVDNERQYFYDITSSQPMQLLCERGRLGKEQISGWISKIITILENSREFLLNENDFVLNPEYVFLHLSESRMDLCYVSGYNRPLKEQMVQFVEYLMDKTNYQEQEAVLLTYGLYQLCREEDCTFDKIKEFLSFHEKKIMPDKEEPSMEVREFMPEKVESEKEIQCYPIENIICSVLTAAAALLLLLVLIKSGMLHDAGGKLNLIKTAALFAAAAATEFLLLAKLLNPGNKKPKIVKQTECVEPAKMYRASETNPVRPDVNMDYVPLTKPPEEAAGMSENTVVLYEKEKGAEYKLAALNRGLYQDILLEEFPFFVGKLKAKVDFVIENEMVSRFHAKLEKEEENFFIIDLNSTNGTYLNHKRLDSNIRMPLCPEDVITFANISYRFLKVG